MIEMFSGFILFLFVDGTPLEYTPKNSLSDCLKTKREIVRNTGAMSNRYRCAEGKLELKEVNGKMHPVKIVED